MTFLLPRIFLLAQLFAGIVFIVWHEVAYRRFIPAREQEFEVFGLLSHAAVDMLTLLGLVIVTGTLFLLPRQDPR